MTRVWRKFTQTIRRYWRLILWLLAMGAAVYGIESSPLPGPAQTALTTVISIFGGLQMMINLIDNRDILKQSEADRQRAEASDRRAEAADRRSEATERENAELRRWIAELERRDASK